MQRMPLLFTALALLPSCATEVASTTAGEQLAKTLYVAEEGVRCDPNFCILFTAQDSDHDGVADVDEIAAGTDPNDPLRYPTLADLARLMTSHELTTWELGRSMIVLLPTRDANGLPIFGGGELLASRKSGLETAGIKAPAGIDISGGFTMSRSALNNEMSFGQLFTAFGRGAQGGVPVRLLADAVGWSPTGAYEITSQTVVSGDSQGNMSGTIKGETKGGDALGGAFAISGNTTTFSVSSDDGDFSQVVMITKNADGSLSTQTSTSVTVTKREGEAGTYEVKKNTTATTVTSKDGAHTVTTSQTTYTETFPNGETKEHPEKPVTTTCDNGSCEPQGGSDPSEPGDYPTDDCGGDPHACESPDSPYVTGYIDPEAAQYAGVTPTPMGVATAIDTLGATILVVQNDNDPLSNYEVPPTGVHDAWGPIALYGGDVDGTYSLVAGFGATPAFVRVPQPEYDPNLNEQKPPMNAPPDAPGCLYCYQPPAN